MKHADVISRLKASETGLVHVDGAAGYIGLSDGRIKKSPTGYVVPLGERAAPSKSNGAVRQLVAVRFGVIIGFMNSGGAGARGVEGYDDVRQGVFDALLGYQLPGTQTPIEYGGARIMGLDRKTSTAWFELSFITQEFVENIGGQS